MTSSNPHIPHATQSKKSGPNVPLIVSLVIVGVLLIGFGALFLFGKKSAGGSAAQSFTSVSESGPFASGGVVFGQDLLPMDSATAVAGEPLVPTTVDRSSGEVDILVYVDYRCPHCMVFEQTNSSVLQSAIEGGSATVEIKPLTFMDRYSAGSEYSSRAAGAFMCVAESAPNKAWLVHNVLLNPAVQPQGEGPGHDNSALAEIISQAMGESDPKVEQCILDETHVAFAQAVNDWTFENPVPYAADQSLMVQSTPLVVVAGVPFSGDIQSPEEFESFLRDSGVVFD